MCLNRLCCYIRRAALPAVRSKYCVIFDADSSLWRWRTRCGM